MTIRTPLPGPPSNGSLGPTYRKGEVWLVVEDPEHPATGTEIWSNRPALIVSANQINDRSGFACVVYLSKSPNKRSTPTHVQIDSHDGNGTTMALCEQVHTVDASRLRRRLGRVDMSAIKEVDAAIAFALSLGRNPDTYGLFKKWENHIKTYGIDLAKEIEALSMRTTDQRVEALQRALELTGDQRDAYRELARTAGALPEAMAAVVTVTHPSAETIPIRD